MVSLELYEHVCSAFGVGYTLRYRLRVLNYNFTAVTHYVSIDTLRVASARLTIMIICTYCRLHMRHHWQPSMWCACSRCQLELVLIKYRACAYVHM